LERLQVDRMVLFGGNGTLRHIPPLLAEWGVRAVGLPATIDNDVAFSELTLGFDSACNFAYGVIDGMIATGHALAGRIFTLETLGGDTGFLALAIAHGASADVVLLPEYSYEADWVARRLADAVVRRGFGLMIYSEGLPGKTALLDAIPALAGIRVRTSQLGHAQRGGRPSHRDRTLAVEMVTLAARTFDEGTGGGLIVVRDGRLTLIERAPADAARLPDRTLYDQINGLS
jgi:6-phosphofructokinase 1